MKSNLVSLALEACKGFSCSNTPRDNNLYTAVTSTCRVVHIFGTLQQTAAGAVWEHCNCCFGGIQWVEVTSALHAMNSTWRVRAHRSTSRLWKGNRQDLFAVGRRYSCSGTLWVARSVHLRVRFAIVMKAQHGTLSHVSS